VGRARMSPANLAAGDPRPFRDGQHRHLVTGGGGGGLDARLGLVGARDGAPGGNRVATAGPGNLPEKKATPGTWSHQGGMPRTRGGVRAEDGSSAPGRGAWLENQPGILPGSGHGTGQGAAPPPPAPQRT